MAATWDDLAATWDDLAIAWDDTGAAVATVEEEAVPRKIGRRSPHQQHAQLEEDEEEELLSFILALHGDS